MYAFEKITIWWSLRLITPLNGALVSRPVISNQFLQLWIVGPAFIGASWVSVWICSGQWLFTINWLPTESVLRLLCWSSIKWKIWASLTRESTVQNIMSTWKSEIHYLWCNLHLTCCVSSQRYSFTKRGEKMQPFPTKSHGITSQTHGLKLIYWNTTYARWLHTLVQNSMHTQTHNEWS